MKHDAIVGQGYVVVFSQTLAHSLTLTRIPIHERVELPEELIPADSRVEIDAKITAGKSVEDLRITHISTPSSRGRLSFLTPITGYFTTGHRMTEEELAAVKGRGWEE